MSEPKILTLWLLQLNDDVFINSQCCRLLPYFPLSCSIPHLFVLPLVWSLLLNCTSLASFLSFILLFNQDQGQDFGGKKSAEVMSHVLQIHHTQIYFWQVCTIYIITTILHIIIITDRFLSVSLITLSPLYCLKLLFFKFCKKYQRHTLRPTMCI